MTATNKEDAKNQNCCSDSAGMPIDCQQMMAMMKNCCAEDGAKKDCMAAMQKQMQAFMGTCCGTDKDTAQDQSAKD